VICRDRYWAILEDLFVELDYRDYLGALQRYRVEHPQDMYLLSMSSFLVDYPFANRLYPQALDLLAQFREWGATVLLTDGDVVFQPHKVERSGLSEAVGSRRSATSTPDPRCRPQRVAKRRIPADSGQATTRPRRGFQSPASCSGHETASGFDGRLPEARFGVQTFAEHLAVIN
jgi:hypothetical protein